MLPLSWGRRGAMGIPIPSNQTDIWWCGLGAKTRELHFKPVNRICLCLKSVHRMFSPSFTILPGLPHAIYEQRCPEKHRIGEIRASDLTSTKLDTSHNAPRPTQSSTSIPFHAPRQSCSVTVHQPSHSKLEFWDLLFAVFFLELDSLDIFHNRPLQTQNTEASDDARPVRGFVP